MTSSLRDILFMGLVRLTRCRVIEFFCRHAVTSSTQWPVTETFISSPTRRLAQKFEMVRTKHFPKRAVNFPGQIGDDGRLDGAPAEGVQITSDAAGASSTSARSPSWTIPAFGDGNTPRLWYGRS